jgi:hypothetical protein
MRWATRQHVLTSKAKRRSLWHRWFAWYPVVVKADDELDTRVWLEHLERKWSVGGYGDQKGHWRYRHPVVDAERANLQAEQYNDVTRDGSEGRGESRLH